LLAIAALAALALTAAIGSATASATVLCKSPKNPCPTSEVLPAGSYNTYGAAGGINDYNLTLKGGFTTYHCGYVGLAERSTAERADGLPATGSRVLSECGLGSGTCAMSMSNSNDQLWHFGSTGYVLAGGITISANCGGSYVCTWSGEYTGRSEYKEGGISETVEGTFKRTSGEEYVCAKEATLKTVPLTLANTNPASYIEN
jgi:hypothetical protein